MPINSQKVLYRVRFLQSNHNIKRNQEKFKRSASVFLPSSICMPRRTWSTPYYSYSSGSDSTSSYFLLLLGIILAHNCTQSLQFNFQSPHALPINLHVLKETQPRQALDSDLRFPWLVQYEAFSERSLVNFRY